MRTSPHVENNNAIAVVNLDETPEGRFANKACEYGSIMRG